MTSTAGSDNKSLAATLPNDVLLELCHYVSPEVLASLALVKRDLLVTFVRLLYKNVELKSQDQAARFFRMLRASSPSTTFYNPRSLVKNLQLSFSLQLGATSPATGAYYPDGRHFFFDMYEPFMEDVEYGIHHLSSLVSLNIFVDMVEDPAALARIINMLHDEMVPVTIKPFVLRLKSLSHVDRIFHGSAEWKHSGARLDTLPNVSDLEVITTDRPIDPEDIRTVIKTWMSNPNQVLKRVHVWMGAECWKEDEDFSILSKSAGDDGLPGYNFTSHWEGNTWDLRLTC